MRVVGFKAQRCKLCHGPSMLSLFFLLARDDCDVTWSPPTRDGQTRSRPEHITIPPTEGRRPMNTQVHRTFDQHLHFGILVKIALKSIFSNHSMAHPTTPKWIDFLLDRRQKEGTWAKAAHEQPLDAMNSLNSAAETMQLEVAATGGDAAMMVAMDNGDIRFVHNIALAKTEGEFTLVGAMGIGHVSTFAMLDEATMTGTFHPPTRRAGPAPSAKELFQATSAAAFNALKGGSSTSGSETPGGYADLYKGGAFWCHPGRHFLNRLRHKVDTLNRRWGKAELGASDIHDLEQFTVFLDKAAKGVSLNLLVHRKPTRLGASDSCPVGLGGYSFSGRAWRVRIPKDSKLRQGSKANNVLEFLAMVVTVWIMCEESPRGEHDCLLQLGDGTTSDLRPTPPLRNISKNSFKKPAHHPLHLGLRQGDVLKGLPERQRTLPCKSESSRAIGQRNLSQYNIRIGQTVL